ncbi:MAG: carboxypeptidase-like regulatory domain-containing protein [Bacteroidota bacterium]
MNSWKRKNRINLQKLTMFAFCFLVSVGSALALQQGQEGEFNQYRGEVIDASTKKPLVFATLALEGTNISTISNTEGEFLLKVG